MSRDATNHRAGRRPIERARRRPGAGRHALVTLWTILCIPVLLTLLCVVAEVSHVWQARVQLENAQEAASLAAVQEWGDRGGDLKQIAAARGIGHAYGLANTIQGLALNLDDREQAPRAAWHFGTVRPAANSGQGEPAGTRFDFTPVTETTKTQASCTAPADSSDGKTIDASKLAVVLQATVRVPPIWRATVGRWIGDSILSAQVAAMYDTSCQPPRPRLIRLDRSAGEARIAHCGP